MSDSPSSGKRVPVSQSPATPRKPKRFKVSYAPSPSPSPSPSTTAPSSPLGRLFLEDLDGCSTPPPFALGHDWTGSMSNIIDEVPCDDRSEDSSDDQSEDSSDGDGFDIEDGVESDPEESGLIEACFSWTEEHLAMGLADSNDSDGYVEDGEGILPNDMDFSPDDDASSSDVGTRTKKNGRKKSTRVRKPTKRSRQPQRQRQPDPSPLPPSEPSGQPQWHHLQPSHPPHPPPMPPSTVSTASGGSSKWPGQSRWRLEPSSSYPVPAPTYTFNVPGQTKKCLEPTQLQQPTSVGISVAPHPPTTLQSGQLPTWRVPGLMPPRKRIQASRAPPSLVTYNGASCSCVPGDHLKDDSLEGSSPLHIDRTCAIATVLGYSFTRQHRYLICDACEQYMPLGHFDKHMAERHPTKLRGETSKARKRDLPSAMGHMSVSFGIPLDQTLRTWTEDAFNGPVAGIAKPVERFQCPGNGCDQWGGMREAHLVRHWNSKTCKRADRSPNMTLESQTRIRVKRWTQLPFGRGHFWVVPVAGPLEPPNPSGPSRNLPRAKPYAVPSGTAAFRPAWLKRVGWAEWRDSQLEKGLTVEQLTSFKALPPPLHVRHIRSQGGELSSPPTSEEIFDWSARRIQKRLVVMLADGNSWLNSIAGELRQALTIASVFFDVLL